MPGYVRGIDDFLSPLPQSPVPLAVLEKVESERSRIEAIVPQTTRRRGGQMFVCDFTITFDGTTYGLRFEDDEWKVIAASEAADDVGLAMQNGEQRECDV